MTVLLQGYLHSLTVCHGLVVADLSKWPQLVAVKIFHYMDDVLLTSDSLAVTKNSSHFLLPSTGMWLGSECRQDTRTWLVSQIFGGGTVWSEKTKIIPESITNKVQAFCRPTTVQQLQTF